MIIASIIGYIVIIFLIAIGFACIGYDWGCKDTAKAYKNKECNKCIHYKTAECPNSNRCYGTLTKPYFRV